MKDRNVVARGLALLDSRPRDDQIRVQRLRLQERKMFR